MGVGEQNEKIIIIYFNIKYFVLYLKFQNMLENPLQITDFIK